MARLGSWVPSCIPKRIVLELEARVLLGRQLLPSAWLEEEALGRGPCKLLTHSATGAEHPHLRSQHGKTRVIRRGGSSLPGVKILTTPVKGSFHVDIPGQPSTCLGNLTALGEQRCIMASSLVTNSLIIPCYDMDKSLLNSRAIAPQGERLPLQAGMPPLITLSCLNSSRIAFKDPSTITNSPLKELSADNLGEQSQGCALCGRAPGSSVCSAPGPMDPACLWPPSRMFSGSQEEAQHPQPRKSQLATYAFHRGQQNACPARAPSREPLLLRAYLYS